MNRGETSVMDAARLQELISNPSASMDETRSEASYPSMAHGMPLDSSSLARFKLDSHVRLTSSSLKIPVAFVCLLDGEQSMVSSSIGLPADRQGCASSFGTRCCPSSSKSVTIVVPNLKEDSRFANNPLVVVDGLQFFAGMPILIEECTVGMVAVADFAPRVDFDEHKMSVMKDISGMISDIMQHHRTATIRRQEMTTRVTSSLMQYIAKPLDLTNALLSQLEESIRQWSLNIKSYSKEDAMLVAQNISSFQHTLSFLDTTIQNGLKLTMLSEQLNSSRQKEGYLQDLVEGKIPHHFSLFTDLEPTFFALNQHVSFDSASYAGNVLSYRWSNAAADDDTTTSFTMECMDMFHSRSVSTSTKQSSKLTMSSGLHGKDVHVDSTLMWATLYGVMMSQSSSWQRVQLSSGVVHNAADSHEDPSALVVLRFTFHDYNAEGCLRNSLCLSTRSSMSSRCVQAEEEMLLLSSTVQSVGGEVRICEDLTPVMRIIEVTLPAVVVVQELPPAVSLATSSGEIRVMHHSRHGCNISSSVCAITVLPVVPEPIEEEGPPSAKVQGSMSSSVSTRHLLSSMPANNSPMGKSISVQHLEEQRASTSDVISDDSEYGVYVGDYEASLPGTPICGGSQNSLCLQNSNRSSASALFDMPDFAIKSKKSSKKEVGCAAGMMGALGDVMNRLRMYFHVSDRRVHPASQGVYEDY